MKHRLVLATAFLLTQSGCFLSRTDSPHLRLESDLVSQYGYRGMVRNERPVLQSAADLEMQTNLEGWVNLELWGNLDLTNETGNAWYSEGQAGRFTQVEVIGSYSERYRGLDWTLGLASHNPQRGPSFPFANRSASTEAFVVISKELEFLRPRLELHWDVDESKDGYFRTGASHGHALSDDLKLEADLAFAYSGTRHSSWNYGTGHSGLADLSTSITGAYALDPRTTLRLRFGASTILDADIASGIEKYGIETDNLWMSVGIEWSH